jgi:AraC-like DNA-binding protein
MPLYIDLHIDDNLTPEIVKQYHVADEAIQAKYGVRYLQVLLNQPQGQLFCLVEGPDKESCIKVHQESHGNVACNILEITERDFNALLANKLKDGSDFTLNRDGTLDTGNRGILSLNLIGSPDDYKKAKKIIKGLFHNKEWQGGEHFVNQLLGVFDSCTTAVEAGLRIRDEMSNGALPIELRMGVSIGPPLKEKGDFFEAVKRSADDLSVIAMNGQITISSKALQLYEGDEQRVANALKVITIADEKFLNHVIHCTENMWNLNNITIADFADELGMSKSQLTRKLSALTNLSPNDFLKEYRLRKSISFMVDQQMNIAEITMAIGFTNPSYFAKCFRARFGKTPSEYMTTK